MDSPSGEITQLVGRWSEGDDEALEQVIELVYDDLRVIARRHLRPSDGASLDTTGLVHEAYLKLVRSEDMTWASRAHFFAFCSKAMRRILIDFARHRNAQKRGGGQVMATLNEDTGATESDIVEVLAVEDALAKLEERSPRMARIVECRFYGGMTVPETAQALDVSERTVEREWRRARTYLLDALQ